MKANHRLTVAISGAAIMLLLCMWLVVVRFTPTVLSIASVGPKTELPSTNILSTNDVKSLEKAFCITGLDRTRSIRGVFFVDEPFITICLRIDAPPEIMGQVIKAESFSSTASAAVKVVDFMMPDEMKPSWWNALPFRKYDRFAHQPIKSTNGSHISGILRYQNQNEIESLYLVRQSELKELDPSLKQILGKLQPRGTTYISQSGCFEVRWSPTTLQGGRS